MGLNRYYGKNWRPCLQPYSFEFLADRVTKGRIYPALARHEARPYTAAWRQFGNHWPWTTPLRIQEYCQQHQFPLNIYSANDQMPTLLWYPICLGFFDFDIDYLALVPQEVRQRVCDGEVRLLFWYHEGDNPQRIQQRLDQLCARGGWPVSSYLFVSANSAARDLERCVYFADFEFWYYQRNLDALPQRPHNNHRSRDFTVLCRVHKPWRAAVMADLDQLGLLANSYWSYCGQDAVSDQDGPISVDLVPQLRYHRERFLAAAPYYCDQLADDQRNDHSVQVPEHYNNSWCNIVIESQMDVDQSGGVFLTEKTFKPIKHAQPFFIVGAAGSLAELRRMGYRVFDHVLDNSYDSETDATRRWCLLRQAIAKARNQGLDQIYQDCQAHIEHNQQLFMTCHHSRLNKLLEDINDRS